MVGAHLDPPNRVQGIWFMHKSGNLIELSSSLVKQNRPWLALGCESLR